MATRTVDTRDIGRKAIREELARTALSRFIDEGFERVTFDTLAADAGVSRSTYLRYFDGKEDVVLFVFDAVAGEIVAALGTACEQAATDWGALRRSLKPAVDFLVEPDGHLLLMQLVWQTPALYARLHQKQATWRPLMVERLSARSYNGAADSSITIRTRVAAALECLTVAIDTWLEADGQPDLYRLLDETFQAIAVTR